MRDVHSQPHVGEVEAVTETNERQTDKVMAHKLLEVLARGFHAQDKHDGLLRPVCCLEKIVELKAVFVGHMRKTLVHPRSAEVPHRRFAHDVHAPGAAESEVDSGVHLFHETGLLALGFDTGVAS